MKKAQKLNTYSDLLIIGLGNPGPKYEKTRHNVGFDLIELLSEQLNLFLKKPLFQNFRSATVISGNRRIHLVKPLTYMNRSGDILPYLMKKYSLQVGNVLVVTDNMDLIPGRVRMKPKGSSAGHNGLKSVMHFLGTGEFYRLYIGIGRPVKEDSVVDHVLGVFSREDRELVDSALSRAAGLIVESTETALEQLLNEINSR